MTHQSMILLATLHVMACMSIGWGIGWLVDEARRWIDEGRQAYIALFEFHVMWAEVWR